MGRRHPIGHSHEAHWRRSHVHGQHARHPGWGSARVRLRHALRVGGPVAVLRHALWRVRSWQGPHPKGRVRPWRRLPRAGTRLAALHHGKASLRGREQEHRGLFAHRHVSCCHRSSKDGHTLQMHERTSPVFPCGGTGRGAPGAELLSA